LSNPQRRPPTPLLACVLYSRVKTVSHIITRRLRADGMMAALTVLSSMKMRRNGRGYIQAAVSSGPTYHLASNWRLARRGQIDILAV